MGNHTLFLIEIKDYIRYVLEIYMIHMDFIYNNSIEVHHIKPIVEAYELRLDEGNLILLYTTYHHKMAECAEIEKVVLKYMIKTSIVENLIMK